MKALITVLFLLASIMPANATTSLFFNEAERQQIDEEFQNNRAAYATPDEHNIHLGAVLYYGPQRWVVWLQGKSWMPETQDNDIRILEVTARQVKLQWKSSTQEAGDEITLRPHQTYNRMTEEVSEGD